MDDDVDLVLVPDGLALDQDRSQRAELERVFVAGGYGIVLLDQAFFTVDAGTFAKFRALLDRPLPPTDKLRRLLKAKAPWDK